MGQLNDRLERQTHSRAKKAMEERIGQDNLDSYLYVETAETVETVGTVGTVGTVETEELAAKTNLLCIDSE